MILTSIESIIEYKQNMGRYALSKIAVRVDMNVEASNRGMPEELHVIHTKLNDLHKNYTLIKQKFNKLSDDTLKMNTKILALQTTSNNIKSSIAAAPLIKNLPDDVHKLSENVATIGSKIINVEDKMEKLKTQHSDFDQKHKSFTSTVKQLQTENLPNLINAFILATTYQNPNETGDMKRALMCNSKAVDDVSHIKVPNVAKPTLAPFPVDSSAINQVHQNVATIGSKIINVEDKMEKLKTQHSDFDQKHKSFTSTVKQLQDDVSHIKVPNVAKPTLAPFPVDSSAINQVHQNMKSLEDQFDVFNSSVNEELKTIEERIAKLKELISTKSPARNQSVSDSQLNQLIHQYVNETVKKSLIVNIVGISPQSSVGNISMEAILGDVNSLIKLYVQLLSKFNQTSGVLTQDVKPQSIIEQLLNKSVDVPYSILSNKIQNVSNDVAVLKSSVIKLQTSDANLTKQMEDALKSKPINFSSTNKPQGINIDFELIFNSF
ncbi:hypothetical protein GQR58_017118 [Nymphon striatum]|nr:hypothetical protein GQR58_017118 [Nymphon striatum]